MSRFLRERIFSVRRERDMVEAYGIVMKEYVAVPEGLLKKTKELQKYFELSYAYVSGLKPKPTKKAKTSKR